MRDDKEGQGLTGLQTNHFIFNLLLVFWLICFAFILATSNNVSYLHFFMFGGVILCMAWSYNLGIMPGLIVSMVVVFVYGSYLLYAVMVAGTLNAVRADYIAWLFIIPVGAFLAGRLGDEFRILRRRLDIYHNLEARNPLDYLTGFLNAKGFMERLDDEVAKAKRFKTDLSVIFLRIGNLYEVQALYGQPGLEAILKGLSEAVAEDVRQIDDVGTMDNHSFGIILPGTQVDGADVVAERLYKKTTRIIAEIDGAKKVIRLKLSIGKATYDPIADEDALIFLERAKEDSRYDMG